MIARRVMAGSRRLWTPKLLTTALWLDAMDAATITSSDGKVSQWNDKSGNGRHVTQATDNLRPTFNVNKVVFNNAHYLIGTTATVYGFNSINSGRSFYIVFDSTVNCAILNNYNINLTTKNVGIATTAMVNCRAGSTTTAQAIFNNPTGNHIGVHLYDGSAKKIYGWRNGNESTNYQNQTITDTGGFESEENYNFGRWGNLSSYYTGAIKELLFVSVAHNTATRQKIEGYLAHKWGLTANLPANHPYKFAPPRV